LGGGTEFTDEAEREKPEKEWSEDDEDEVGQLTLIRPVIPTPAGMMPVNVYGSLTKAFNFWVAHTNFDITPEIRDAIKTVPGVETLDILTRYRMRIGFGHAFDSAEVKEAIHEACQIHFPAPNEENPDDIRLDTDTKEKVDLLQKQAKANYAFWVVYVLPNAQIVFQHTEDVDAYANTLELCRQAQELAGGVIYTCEDI
jgi:hypothetical protein